MFRFTIRDLLWLTVIAAILAAFSARAYHQARAAVESERRAAEAEKRAMEAMLKAQQ